MQQKWREHHWQKHQGRWMPPGGFGGPNNFNNPGADPSAAPGTNPSQNAPGQYTPGPQPDPTPGPEPTQPGPTGATSQTAPGSATGPGPNSNQTGGAFVNSSNNSNYTSEDYIDTTSIFGGVHKKVVSKNFKGGDIVTFLGGSEIDLSQAEIVGTARLDVTQVMGGTKIIVPAHWEVRSEVTALFAGFEDKRQQPAMVNPDKVLIIDGTSIFGGIELKNY
jgi:hypothetical protein